MKLALFGYGGHAREVACQINEEVTYFVDDQYANNVCKPISSFDSKQYMMMVTVGDPELRAQLVKKLPSDTKYYTFIHPTALIMDSNVVIGEGSFIGAYSVLTTNIVIGKHAILNRGNQIGHDTVIGDFFSAMPGAIVSGNCMLQNNVYIGSNATIREKISITSSVVIGMNSCITKNIVDSGTFVGVPAKRIK